uniref:Uncharacterized protein n=1 Tax=Arundo donax TaxID=35708 RepID=A0A0A9BBB3_ARUDO
MMPFTFNVTSYGLIVFALFEILATNFAHLST